LIKSRLGVTGAALGSFAGGLLLAKQRRDCGELQLEGACAVLGLVDPVLQFRFAQ
jgi:hypothetical protein